MIIKEYIQMSGERRSLGVSVPAFKSGSDRGGAPPLPFLFPSQGGDGISKPEGQGLAGGRGFHFIVFPEIPFNWIP